MTTTTNYKRMISTDSLRSWTNTKEYIKDILCDEADTVLREWFKTAIPAGQKRYYSFDTFDGGIDGEIVGTAQATWANDDDSHICIECSVSSTKPNRAEITVWTTFADSGHDFLVSVANLPTGLHHRAVSSFFNQLKSERR
jgi:hypothetical protein